jgi:hypothetical protein
LVINYGTIIVILLTRLSVLIYYKSSDDIFAFYLIFLTEIWLTLKIILLAHYATLRPLLDSFHRVSESSQNFHFNSQHDSSSESNSDHDNFKR